MRRIAFLMAFTLVALVAVLAGRPAISGAQDASPVATPAAPTELCTGTPTPDWESTIDVQPPGAADGVVRPVGSADRDLYAVVWTLQPGACIPYSAAGNMKDGAVVLIVQKGSIVYTWQVFGANSSAKVYWGPTEGPGEPLDPNTPQTLSDGDWITQDQQVWFTFQAGDEGAVIIKAVWAKPPEDHGCGGGCK
jgi:hypothetical protein